MTPHTLQLTALMIWIVYNVIVYLKFGLLKSVSASFYSIGKSGYLFTLTLWAVAILLIISHPNPLMFLSGAFLCFTAATPDYKDKQPGIIHITGATGSMVLAFASLIIFDGLLFIVPAILTGCLCSLCT